MDPHKNILKILVQKSLKRKTNKIYKQRVKEKEKGCDNHANAGRKKINKHETFKGLSSQHNLLMLFG